MPTKNTKNRRPGIEAHIQGVPHPNKLPSRRKPPTTLPLFLMSPEGCEYSVPIAVNEHPGSLTFPIFEPPGILDGKPLERALDVGIDTIVRNPNRLTNLMQRHGGRPIQIGMTNFAVFDRFLQKIAHGIVVAECRGLPDGFSALLPKQIVANDSDTMFMNYFTGCPTNKILDPIPGASHIVTISAFAAGGHQYIGVDIRLFAWWPSPLYRVIVAER
jgi:hypothetical protein